MDTFLSVIIPCYNELANLRRGVMSQVLKILDTESFSWEVIVSDDGSTDGGYEFLEKFVSRHRGVRLLKNPKGGKAFALRSGIEAAKGKYSLFSDMDQSTPLTEFDKFLPYLSHGSRIVIGSRGYKRENFPLLRRIGSPLFLTFRRALILSGIQDTQCGFKCFETAVARKIFRHLMVFNRRRGEGWRVGAWDVELLYVAEKLGYEIKEVPVSWRDRDTSTSKEREFVSESVEMLKEVIRVRLNSLRGKYDLD